MIEIITDDKLGSEETEIKSHIKNVLTFAIQELKPNLLKNPFYLSVLITNNFEISKINLKYRNKNLPTNVLSFPLDEERMIFDEIPSKILGDIVLSLEKIKIESIELNKPFNNHLTHILIHGLLHLLGYNHQNDKEAEIMERFETNILSKLSIPAPYN
tara:strand:+ start:1989 stop:2462 length:474 start_codon:yes stop_codon:yes gene_type:complete